MRSTHVINGALLFLGGFTCCLLFAQTAAQRFGATAPQTAWESYQITAQQCAKSALSIPVVVGSIPKDGSAVVVSSMGIAFLVNSSGDAKEIMQGDRAFNFRTGMPNYLSSDFDEKGNLRVK